MLLVLFRKALNFHKHSYILTFLVPRLLVLISRAVNSFISVTTPKKNHGRSVEKKGNYYSSPEPSLAPYIGIEPRREKKVSWITCMPMLRANPQGAH